jgi:hypothetical protein
VFSQLWNSQIVELHHYSPCIPSWYGQGQFYLLFTFIVFLACTFSINSHTFLR